MTLNFKNLLLFLSPIIKFKIIGKSMESNYKEGETVFVNKLSYFLKKIKIGDVVAVKNQEAKIFIKRIAKIKGEKLFVLGDNLKESIDSRHFGWILRKDILGKVVFKI